MILVKTGAFELRSFGTDRYYLLRNITTDQYVLMVGDDAAEFEGLLLTMMTSEAIATIWQERLGYRAQPCRDTTSPEAHQ